MKKLLIPILLTTHGLAEETGSSNVLENILNNTNEYRKDIHKSLVKLSNNIDEYLDTNDIKNGSDEYSNTYGLIELSTYKNEGENIKFDQKVKIKLKLPKLKENFRLELETDEIRENVDHVENHTTNNNDDFNLGVSYNELLGDNIDFKTKLGIKLKSSKLDPFIKLEAKKTWENINSIDYTISQSLKQSVVKKLESTSYLRLDKYINDFYSIHNYNEYYWKSSQSNDSEIYNSIYLNQILNNKDFLTYTLGMNTNNIDSELEVKRYSAKIQYRHFLEKWLYIDVIPENYYKEETDFESEYGVRFNIGMFFNKY